MLPYSNTFLLRVFTTVFTFGFLFLPSPNAQAAAGEPDTSFVATLSSTISATRVNPIVIQPDGKIIIGGEFHAVGKYPRTGVARLNADGTVDATFRPVGLDAAVISQLALQPDGKIFIVGEFRFREQRRGILRLNPDGSSDEAFNNKPLFATIYKGYDIVLLPDGKIVFAGLKVTEFRGSVWRLSPDGSTEIERTLINLYKLAPAPDGKLAGLGNNGEVLRLNADLSTDPTYQVTNGGSSFLDVAVQADGKVVVVGSFTTLFGFPRAGIVRFNSDGTVDSDFASINPAQPNDQVRTVKILANGKLLIGGRFDTVSGVQTRKIALLNADGSLDASFVSQIPLFSNSDAVNDFAVQADGKILADRYRLNTDGSVDSSYAPQLRYRGLGNEVVVQPDNKILVGGQFMFANDKAIRALTRFNADGSVDDTFNQNIYTNLNTYIRAIALQSDGKILVGGSSAGFTIRLTSTGALDTTFPVTGETYDIKVQPDGKILIAGNGYIKRFNNDGTLDETFNAAINGIINKIALQPDGKVVIVGDLDVGVKRLNVDGTNDATFTPNGGPNGTVYDVALQADGKIVIGGNFTGVNFDLTRKYLARLNTNGSLDATFAPVLGEFFVRTIKIQRDGKILTGGYQLSGVSGYTPGRIVRVNQNGTLDPTFNNALNLNDTVWSIDLQSDSKIIIGGWFTRAGDVANGGVARLLNPAAPSRAPFDFDGDGKTDITVFRPADGVWYITYSSNNSFTGVQFGTGGDLLAPADYDGDGKTDFAVFRPSDGTWYLLQSSAGFRAAQFGANGDIPVPGDFDGDGKANLAVFRPSTGSWYIARATGVPSQNFDSVPFGANGDKPIAGADFDGDGKSDVAVFRPSTGDWYRLNSSNNQFVGVHFGIAEDKPVAADYDGDGRTDLAVFRPSDGVWYRINSGTDTFTAGQFGIAEDRPVPGDYDGDGRADLAVFRPSSGTWYLLRSTSGFTGVQFGANGDLPAPNAFVR